MANQAPDQIKYSDRFQEGVQGRLKARFRLDAYGKPIFTQDDENPRLRHYEIVVFLASPKAKQIKRVTYFMDDPSFSEDPEGSSVDSDNDFPVEITSYGDVEVVVTVEIADQKLEQRAWLSTMLENGHTDDLSPEIRLAIQRIKVN